MKTYYMLTVIYNSGEIFDFRFETRDSRLLFFKDNVKSRAIQNFTFWEIESEVL